MKIGIVMPTVLDNPELVGMTLNAVSHLRSCKHELGLFLVANHYTQSQTGYLRGMLKKVFIGSVTVLNEPGVERSIANSWNLGIRHFLVQGYDYFMGVANDTELSINCIDEMVTYGESDCDHVDLWCGHNVDYWSSSGNKHSHITMHQNDFNCFMIRPRTIERHGWPDPNFFPAYIEDTDYVFRIWQRGNEVAIIHAAQLRHRSAGKTSRDSASAKTALTHWMNKNLQRLNSKWGVPNRVEALVDMHKHPFNDPSRPLWWWEGVERWNAETNKMLGRQLCIES